MPLKIKKLLVQFEYDERTRWLFPANELCNTVAVVMRSVALCHSAGTIPAITVSEEETPETNHAASH
jgi:hypothetical protein